MTIGLIVFIASCTLVKTDLGVITEQTRRSAYRQDYGHGDVEVFYHHGG
jgi:hypothetical protein